MAKALLSAILLGVVSTACAPGGEPLPPPKLGLAESQHDFGRVAQGAVVRHAFPLSNDGGIALSVLGLRSACGCEARLDPAGPVPPGGRAVVEVALDTGDTFGRQRRTVTLFSDDPERPSALLVLEGDVDLEAAAEPRSLYVGRVRPGDSVERSVRVRVREGVSVGSARADGAVLRARVLPPGDGAGGAEIRLQVSESAPDGPFQAEMQVSLVGASRPSLRVAVLGVVDRSPPPESLSRPAAGPEDG